MFNVFKPQYDVRQLLQELLEHDDRNPPGPEHVFVPITAVETDLLESMAAHYGVPREHLMRLALMYLTGVVNADIKASN